MTRAELETLDSQPKAPNGPNEDSAGSQDPDLTTDAMYVQVQNVFALDPWPPEWVVFMMILALFCGGKETSEWQKELEGATRKRKESEQKLKGKKKEQELKEKESKSEEKALEKRLEEAKEEELRKELEQVLEKKKKEREPKEKKSKDEEKALEKRLEKDKKAETLKKARIDKLKDLKRVFLNPRKKLVFGQHDLVNNRALILSCLSASGRPCFCQGKFH